MSPNRRPPCGRGVRWRGCISYRRDMNKSSTNASSISQTQVPDRSWALGEYSICGEAAWRNADAPLALGFSLHLDHEFTQYIVAQLTCRSNLRAKYHALALRVLAGVLLTDRSPEGTGAVHYSRSKGVYRRPAQYQRFQETYAAVMSVVEALENAGMVNNEVAPTWGERRQDRESTLRSTSDLALIARDMDWRGALVTSNSRAGDLVIIRKRHSRQLLPWPCRTTGNRLTHKVSFVNEHLSDLRIHVPMGFVQRTSPCGHCLHVTNPNHPDRAPSVLNFSMRNTLHMPHLDCFELGGRPVGMDAMNIPSKVRKHCLLNGQPIGEIDFSGSHIALAYTHFGIKPPACDPYEDVAKLPFLRRGEAKRSCLIALNTSSERGAIAAIKRHVLLPASSTRGALYNGTHEEAAKLILETFQRSHSAISSLIGKDFGVKAQNAEAMIMLSSLEDCARMGIHAVPMHDGFTCAKRDVGVMRDIAAANWERQTGFLPPKITVE